MKQRLDQRLHALGLTESRDRKTQLKLSDYSIQDLAEARSARPFPLKIFDEPFDNLDARGQEMAISWVKKQAKERGTALLMTHNESLSALSEPDVIWTVVLDENGATVARVGVNDGAYK